MLIVFIVTAFFFISLLNFIADCVGYIVDVLWFSQINHHSKPCVRDRDESLSC